MITEKVSTVGVRNQVTLPKLVRERLNITGKTAVFIQRYVIPVSSRKLQQPAEKYYTVETRAAGVVRESRDGT
ncbi:MAG: hypothetical protein ACFFD4_12865 [Candidatus Odinarchaeota archaeon]